MSDKELDDLKAQKVVSQAELLEQYEQGLHNDSKTERIKAGLAIVLKGIEEINVAANSSGGDYAGGGC